MLEYFLPILRADFGLHESYNYNKSPDPKIYCNLTVFHGTKDKSVIHENIYKWDEFTENEIQFYQFEGNHFFINDYLNKMLEIIQKSISTNCTYEF